MKGYKRKILHINLTDHIITEETLNSYDAKKFIGGSGLSAYYYYNYLKQYEHSPEPFSPENPLYIITGILTGLPMFCASRTTLCSRSPLTNIWGESNIGGYFGSTLKYAGYDGIIIKGRADNPVFLSINDNEVSIEDATSFWGQGTYASIKHITKELQNEYYQTLCIGPAGENLVKYSCVMSSGGRTAGRTGMGAVMGSKNLKAITVNGSGSPQDYDLPKEFKKLSKQMNEEVKEDFLYGLLKELGTAGNVDLALEMYGDMPIRNWSQGIFESGVNLSGTTMSETILTGTTSCFGCPIGCGRQIEITEGPYKLSKTDGPEFETLASLGTNLMIDDLEAVSYANHKANDYGIDTISTGAIIGVLFYLCEKNCIPPEDLPPSIDCSFGNKEALIHLLQLIAYRQGIGNLLAEGSKKLASYYGKPEYAPQVAGLEAAFHDPRAFTGMALAYLTSPRGACHLNGDAYLAQQGLQFPEVGVENLPDDRFANTGIAIPIANLQNYRQLYNAIGICQFFNPSANLMSGLLGIAIEENLQPSDLAIIGDRIFTLKRIINLLLGWTPEIQKLPDIMLTKLDGPTEGNIPNIETQLKEWYHYRKYDFETGKPTQEKLQQLDLHELVEK